jgi:hypothetical protein
MYGLIVPHYIILTSIQEYKILFLKIYYSNFVTLPPVIFFPHT